MTAKSCGADQEIRFQVTGSNHLEQVYDLVKQVSSDGLERILESLKMCLAVCSS